MLCDSLFACECLLEPEYRRGHRAAKGRSFSLRLIYIAVLGVSALIARKNLWFLPFTAVILVMTAIKPSWRPATLDTSDCGHTFASTAASMAMGASLLFVLQCGLQFWVWSSKQEIVRSPQAH